MVVGENPPVKSPGDGVPPATIDNIMSGISNTGSVKMNNHRKKLRQRFDIIKKLGQGTYGKVQLGINKETGQEVAIKTIKKCKIETEADLIRIRREVQIMSSVQHPNIIHIYEVFENREKMVLVMGFAAGGELYDYLSERKVLAEEEARRVFRQISTAVYYCHKHKICHRDLKLENILLDENGNAKIADFGLSNVFDEQRLLATFCGSPLYASPEIVKGTPYQGPEVDCWSLGVLLYTLVYGAMPFDGSNFKRLVKQISAGDYYEPKKPSPASPLIKEMLTVCPQRRANIEQICNHWWVNEGYDECCLDLAEGLANQTPVRLDVLLSLAPSNITSDQLVVPAAPEDTKSNERVTRSHSVGSIRDIGNTEAEQRILDMVAAGGEAALAPSPTRIMTPMESPAQPKRKLETTISTENALEGARKRDKLSELTKSDTSRLSYVAENMDVDQQVSDTPVNVKFSAQNLSKNFETVEEMCDKLLEDPNVNTKTPPIEKGLDVSIDTQKASTTIELKPKNDSPLKTTKKIMNKTKTADLSDTLNKSKPTLIQRKNSLPDNVEPNDSGRSKIIETSGKLQSSGNPTVEKLKKTVVPGISVGNVKKEFERKASLSNPIITSAEKRMLEKRNSEGFANQSIIRKEDSNDTSTNIADENIVSSELELKRTDNIMESESKSSLSNFSLEEARRSMENSIALLNQAKTESNKEVDQLCARTENVTVSDETERQKKLKSAREIIGNAIPVGRICMAIRKPPVPFGINGRSISGSVVPSQLSSHSGLDRKSIRLQIGPEPADMRTANITISSPKHKVYDRESFAIPATKNNNTTKTSRAEITLKSATLPRRKTARAEIQLDIKQPHGVEPNQMRFQTEIKHPMPDLRSAPIQEQSSNPCSPLPIQHRASSLEPQAKERVTAIQRPSYTSSGSNVTVRSSLSRQSTNDSDTDTNTTATLSQSQIAHSDSSQPIKKSPREFIIPIAVEGGGFVTPRANSLEPSESLHGTSKSNFNLSKRRLASIVADRDSEDESSFNKLNTSIVKADNDEPRFTMHRLRSTRPFKKIINDPNDSASSGDEDDEDGFEILTAENLFSTLLSRVRALTNRMNVNANSDTTFPSSRLFSNLRSSQNPFWNHDPFGSRLNNGSNAWRHSISRDLGSDFDSMFNRSGATLPRETIAVKNSTSYTNPKADKTEYLNSDMLDLADLDLSRLRLTKKDLEALSTITPDLPKHCQEQLLAQLPPNQARKLSRTLSMQNNSNLTPIKIYKRSLSNCPDMKNDMDKFVRHKEQLKLSDMCSPKNYNNSEYGISNNSKNLPLKADKKSVQQYGREPIINNEVDIGIEIQSTTPVPHNSENPLQHYSLANLSDCYNWRQACSLSNNLDDKFVRSSINQRQISPNPKSNLRNIYEKNNVFKEKRLRELETENVLKEIRSKAHDRLINTNKLVDNDGIGKTCDSHNRKSSIPNLQNMDYFSNKKQYHCRNKSVDFYDNKTLKTCGDICKADCNPTNTQERKTMERVSDENKNVSLEQPPTTDLHNQDSQINDDTNSKNSVNKVINNIVKKAKTQPDTKLCRPKSYPSKEQPIKTKLPIKVDEHIGSNNNLYVEKLYRPQSFPNSKLVDPKETKKFINTGLYNLKEKSEKPQNPKNATVKDLENLNNIADTSTTNNVASENKSNEGLSSKILKNISSQKKSNHGFLYSIGQKFEKLRESSKTKEKKDAINKHDKTASNLKREEAESNTTAIPLDNLNHKSQTTPHDRKSKIDTMIRHLIERAAIPQNTDLTESKLIKRAVSVEDVSGNYNKSGVNKVLGLFKKIEKDHDLAKSDVKGTHSSSTLNVSNADLENSNRQRPKSSSFVSKLRKNSQPYTVYNRDENNTRNDSNEIEENNLTTKIPIKYNNCSLNHTDNNVTKRQSNNNVSQTSEHKQRLKNNRMGLVLDFTKIDTESKKFINTNCNENRSENCISNDKINGNINVSSYNLNNCDLSRPSYESIANYSSDSRSPHDDLASTSTIVSPTEDIDLSFDKWSTCSDEKNISGTTPSPSLLKPARSYRLESPTIISNNNEAESVNDRIKRKSFYCRFNEKKPKRQSNIVGPAAREYYRESTARLKSRPSEHVCSPQPTDRISYDTNTIRPPIGSRYDDCKYSWKSTSKFVPDEPTILRSGQCNKYNSSPKYSDVTNTDYLNKPRNYFHMYDTASSPSWPSTFYNTYNPKRRTSYASNSPIIHECSSVDNYATLGRKNRPYDHRSISLLDSTSSNSDSFRYKDYISQNLRKVTGSNLNTRTPSMRGSPTNI